MLKVWGRRSSSNVQALMWWDDDLGRVEKRKCATGVTPTPSESATHVKQGQRQRELRPTTAPAAKDGVFNPHNSAPTIRAFVQSGFNEVATRLTARRTLTEPPRFPRPVICDSPSLEVDHGQMRNSFLALGAGVAVAFLIVATGV